MGRVGLAADAGAVEVQAVRSGRARLVLAALALADGPVSTDVLADMAWSGAPPPQWKAALRNIVSGLRQLISHGGTAGDEVIVNDRGGYRLALPPDGSVDALEVIRLARLGAAELDASRYEAAASAADAAGRRAGDLLGSADADWLEPHRAALATARQLALQIAAEARLALGDTLGAVRDARRAVDMAPFDERAHRSLIAAHSAAGDRALALKAFEQCRTLLADELGVPPSEETVRTYLEALGTEPNERSGLPTADTLFIGRDAERAAMAAALAEHRVVTVVGPGGIGKTRLAIEVARDLRGTLSGGVTFVPLESADDSLVPGLVAAALGIEPNPSSGVDVALVTALITAGPALLVLDGCDHALGGIVELATTLLPACPGLHVLATSRQRLGVAAEHVMPLGPMSSDDAVTLLVDRAVASGADLPTDPAALVELPSMCDRVGRVPLAIELSARLLTTTGIGDAIDLLAAGTGMSTGPVDAVGAALANAVSALDDDERVVFARLGVLGGPADLSIAREVVAGDGMVPGPRIARMLAALAERGLLRIDRTGARWRYSQHEVFRARALELLGPADGIRANSRLAKAIHAILPADPQAPPNIERTRAVLPLIRSYFAAATSGRAPAAEALRLAYWLHRFWAAYDLTEGRIWLARLLAASPVDTAHRSTALLAFGYVCYAMGDTAHAEPALEEAARLLRQEDDALESRAYLWLGNLAEGRDAARCTSAYQRVIEAAARHGDDAMADSARCALGTRAFESGAHADGLAMWHDAIERARTAGVDDRVVVLLAEYAWMLVMADRREAADVALGELTRRLGNQVRIAAITAHHATARLALARHEMTAARASIERALATMEEIGASRDRPRLHCTLARIAVAENDLPAAHAICADARAAADASGELWLQAEVLEATAITCAADQPDQVLQLVQAADAIRTTIECARYPLDTIDISRALRIAAGQPAGEESGREAASGNQVRSKRVSP